MNLAGAAEIRHSAERSQRTWLSCLVLAWGIQAIVTQSLLVREAVVLMFGSELAWGLVLFAWLLGAAVGAAIGGGVAGRVTRADLTLVVVLIGLSTASCVELWVFRGARGWLGVEPGELLPLPKTALAALLFISPISALIGMAFPLACCVRGAGQPDGPRGLTFDASRKGGQPAARGLFQLGNVYAIESAGSLIGGAAFSFYAVEQLKPIQTALICGAVTVGVSACLLHATCRSRRPAVFLAGVTVAVLLVAAFRGDSLERLLVQRWWRNTAPGYELCAEVESKYQKLTLGRRSGQFTLYSDGHVAADFPDPYTFVPLAHFWLCQHPSPRNVLVLGGGAEGLLSEILRQPVKHVDYVEPDPRLIKLIEPFLGSSDVEALRSERVSVQHRDARYFVKTQKDRFDLVIARLPEPISALRARFYTDEFFSELRRAMTPSSVLCLTAAAAPAELSSASAEYLASIRAALLRHFPQVTVSWGDPAHLLAASQTGLLTDDPAELTRRYVSRNVQSDSFDPSWFDGATDWLEAYKVRLRADELDSVAGAPVSTDLHPIVYLQRLALWERMTSVRGTRVIEWLRSVRWYELVEVLLVLAGVTMLGCCLMARARILLLHRDTDRGRTPLPSRERGRGEGREPAMDSSPPSPGPLPQRGGGVFSRAPASSIRRGLTSGAIVLSVGTTGFATMALSIIWLFAFQNLYGYVYQRIGWIIALFMGGLVVGCELVNRLSKRRNNEEQLYSFSWRWLIGVDIILALLAAALPFILTGLSGVQGSPLAFSLVEWCVSIMVAVTGVLGGAAFPLAAGLQTVSGGRSGAVAGVVVGADHAGACLGALLCGILLVPVFGTVVAASLLAAMKLTSAGLLVLTRGKRPNPFLPAPVPATRRRGF